MNGGLKFILFVIGIALFIPLLMMYLDIMSEFLTYLFDTKWIESK